MRATFPFLQDAGDDAFAAAIPVALGGVDEVATGVQRGVEGAYGVFVALWSPASADGPRAEADL